MNCPECGREDVNTRYRVVHFEYGEGRDAQTIRAVVPVRECLFCGFEWTDHEAELAKARALNRHFGQGDEVTF